MSDWRAQKMEASGDLAMSNLPPKKMPRRSSLRLMIDYSLVGLFT